MTLTRAQKRKRFLRGLLVPIVLAFILVALAAPLWVIIIVGLLMLVVLLPWTDGS